MTQSMVGTPLAPDNTSIEIHLHSPIPINLILPGIFTSQSSFNLLHFLHHLNNCAFEDIHIGSRIDLSLPSSLPFSIYCNHLHINDIYQLSGLEELTSSVFKPQEVQCSVRAD